MNQYSYIDFKFEQGKWVDRVNDTGLNTEQKRKCRCSDVLWPLHCFSATWRYPSQITVSVWNSTVSDLPKLHSE